MDDSVMVKCRECNGLFDVQIVKADYYEWLNGKNIQDAMPYLGADDRELLISRTCGCCFDMKFTAPL